jgi:hypothetical protein
MRSNSSSIRQCKPARIDGVFVARWPTHQPVARQPCGAAVLALAAGVRGGAGGRVRQPGAAGAGQGGPIARGRTGGGALLRSVIAPLGLAFGGRCSPSPGPGGRHRLAADLDRRGDLGAMKCCAARPPASSPAAKGLRRGPRRPSPGRHKIWLNSADFYGGLSTVGDDPRRSGAITPALQARASDRPATAMYYGQPRGVTWLAWRPRAAMAARTGAEDRPRGDGAL